MHFDVIIKNGHIFDPGSGIDYVGSLAIKNGYIAGVPDSESHADLIVDAKGCFVSPGFIETHTHIAFESVDSGLPADVSQFQNGVTSAVDGGSHGVTGYRALLRYLSTQMITSKILLNVSPVGLATHQFVIPYHPDTWNYDKFEDALKEHDQEILGFKILIAKNRFLPEDGMKPFIKTLELGEKYNKKIVAHVMGSPFPQEKILEKLRPGDTFLHVYTGGEHTVLDQNENIIQAVFDAKERGVWMDSSRGMKNISLKVAKIAVAQGLTPNLIGSDCTYRSWNRSSTHGLTHCLSMHLALGMPLKDVITCATTNAARFMDMEGKIGTLKTGAFGDVCIFSLKDFSNHCYSDDVGATLQATELIVPQMVFKKGLAVFRQADFY